MCRLVGPAGVFTLALALAAGSPSALAQAASAPALAPTPDTGAGPEYRADSPSTSQLWRPGDPGEPLDLRGRVLGTGGRPVVHATVELWQADGAGAYQPDRYRARLLTDETGAFSVATVLPGQRYGAKHIHISVSHPSHESLATRIVFRGDPNLDAAEDDPLAIVLEEARRGGERVLVGEVRIVLRDRGQ